MSDQLRSSDQNQNKRYFRSDDRVFRQGDGWYYSAREGDRGPYAVEKIARAELARFIQEQKDLAALKAGNQGVKPGGGAWAIEFERDGTTSPRPRPGDVWKGRPDVD